MRYLDSGNRHPREALGTWLQNELTEHVTELRWQTGFFSADGLAPFIAVLQELRRSDGIVRAVIGSNNGDTLRSDAETLLNLIGIPRPNARLGIVNFSGAFFHPKTYHIRRANGTEAAYVGSANLTRAGIGSLHVEAGVILDTAEGDPLEILHAVAEGIDQWFSGSRAGIDIANGVPDLDRLLETGVLSANQTPRAEAQRGGNNSASARPRLQPLINISLPTIASAATVAVTVATPAPTVTSSTAVPRSPPFPEYVLFDPVAVRPTSGPAALSGASLPGSVAGIIVRLNRDSARHWLGNPGTANISIPVPTVQTLRFGVFRGRHERPRSEFDLEVRLIHPGGEFRAAPEPSNVMVYGFTPDETGHGDVRLVIPARPAREVLQFANGSGIAPPTDGDLAILEWPTATSPTFKLTVFDRRTPLYNTVRATMDAAIAGNAVVGQGACWLPPSISPLW